jgi:membrane protein implicated in regulation of membrane protease activity
MYEIFFGEHAVWFTVPAFMGTVVFLLRVVMMFLGDFGLDLHHDAGIDAHHADPSEGFKVLSIQSIAAFFMGFGWGGIGALKGTGFSVPVSLVIAALCGAAMTWLLGLALKAIHDLQTSGNIEADATVGAEATVYANIPAAGEGQGQVQVIVDNRQRTYNAVSTGPALSTQDRVRVVGITDPNTLAVAPA